MVYKYCENRNFEDFASGRVIVHRTGYPNFPVRLAQEILCWCLRYLDAPGRICVYDPCCGGGYLLTVLGFLNYEKIRAVMASDINGEAVQLAHENLSLLQISGLERRIQQLNQLLLLHNKTSHVEALDSAANLLSILENATHEIEHNVFQADILSPDSLVGQDFKADIIFTDVPYGKLVDWQNSNESPVNFLDQLLPVVTEKSVIAVCSDKSQKFHSERFQRVEKQVVGKRLFQIFISR